MSKYSFHKRITAKLINLQTDIVLPLNDLRDINRKMIAGEMKARKAKMTEANLRLVISIAKEIY